MINIKNITVSFSGHKVLDDITIDFLPNRVYGIAGLNGSGKTTFFNVLSSSLKADNGQVNFNDAAVLTKDIAYLETVNFFYSGITGNEYLKIFKQSNPEFNLDSLQEYLKLPLNDLIETYSTGMKKKLALLGVLKQMKSIFILDEPFNGLDMETNKILELIIASLKEKGKTVFLSSHLIDPLLTVCDEIHFLESGRFTKSFYRSSYHKIEEELFGKLKAEAKGKISASI